MALTGSTLSAWLAKGGVDKTTIGLFALVAIPYAYKFVWSPLVDGLRERADGRVEDLRVICRIDTPIEIDYYQHGGILPYVLRQLVAKA